MISPQRSTFGGAVLAIAAGMGGEMHLAIPGLGTVAMLDLVSYGIAIPIILLKWSQMGKHMRRSLLWSFAWTGAAMMANLVNFHEPLYWLKCVSLASSSWAIIAASYLLLRNQPLHYLWYLVGTGIGGWIALYYFRNGALEGFAQAGGAYGDVGTSLENLMDKQIYPSIVRGVFLGCVLPFYIWWRRAPTLLPILISVFAGCWLLTHGGSRSSFGIFIGASAFGLGASYFSRGLRVVAKRPLVMALIAAVGVAVVFGGYKYMVSSGQLGDSERHKFENEFGEGGQGVLKGRASMDVAFVVACQTAGIGSGMHLQCHSVIANALCCEGFIGFLFWVYFYLQVLWFVCRRLSYADRQSVFILTMVLLACWDVFGSPFGTRHKFFVLMAFIALCRDDPRYGVGAIFAPEMLGRGRYVSMGEKICC